MKQGFLDMIRESSVEKVSDSVFFLIKPIWGSCVDFCNRRLKKKHLDQNGYKIESNSPCIYIFRILRHEENRK